MVVVCTDISLPMSMGMVAFLYFLYYKPVASTNTPLRCDEVESDFKGCDFHALTKKDKT